MKDWRKSAPESKVKISQQGLVKALTSTELNRYREVMALLHLARYMTMDFENNKRIVVSRGLFVNVLFDLKKSEFLMNLVPKWWMPETPPEPWMLEFYEKIQAYWHKYPIRYSEHNFGAKSYRLQKENSKKRVKSLEGEMAIHVERRI